MTTTNVFAKTLRASNEWVAHIMRELAIDDERRAYRALRAGLHAIRDRLSVEEAADLAAQLPMLVRGLYYEGWRPTGKPERFRHRDQFLARISEETEGDPGLDPEAVARAVVRVLAQHVSKGELDDVAANLPRELAALWAESLA